MAKLMVSVLLLFFCIGCAAYHKEIDTNPAFSSHRYRYYDVEIRWRTERSDSGLRISGTVRNLRDYYLQDLEVNARLLDENRKVVARGAYADFPNYLPPGKTEPFQLEFPHSSAKRAERIQFSYQYSLAEAAPAFRVYDDVPHFGAFDSPL